MKIDNSLCDRCGKCEVECPKGAIWHNKKGFFIDNAECIECWKCEDVCERGAIYDDTM
jgi:ferredoxin